MHNIKIWLDFLQSFFWVSMFWFLLISLRKPLHHFLETLNEIMEKRGLKVTKSGLEIPSSKNNTNGEEPLSRGENPLFLKDKDQDTTIELYQKDKGMLNSSNDPFAPFYEMSVNEGENDDKDPDLFHHFFLSLENWLTHHHKKGYDTTACLKNKLIQTCIDLYFEQCLRHITPYDLCSLYELSKKQDPSPEEKVSTAHPFSKDCLLFLEDHGFVLHHDGQVNLSLRGYDFLKYAMKRDARGAPKVPYTL